MSSPPAHHTPRADSTHERPPAFYRRRKKRANQIGQILLRRGVISPVELRDALRVQEQEGGHIGAILTRIGACEASALADALIDQVRLARDAGSPRNLAVEARANPSIVGLRVRCRPTLTLLLLLGLDVAVLSASLCAAWALTGHLGVAQCYGILVVVWATVAAFAGTDLYAPTPPSPPEEIRRTTTRLSVVFAAFAVTTALDHRAPLIGSIGVGAWFLGWVLSVWFVPFARAIVRWRLARRPWWGHPAVVLGAGKAGRAVVRTLLNHPRLGLKPVAILDDDPSRQGTLRATFGKYDLDIESVRGPQTPAVVHGRAESQEDADGSARAVWGQFSEVEGVPVVGGLSLAPLLSQRLGIRTAVIAMSDADSSTLLSSVERFSDSISRVLVVPNLLDLAHFGAVAQELGGVLGIEVRRQLLRGGPRLVKRLMDLVLTSIGVLLISPVLLLLAIIVKLDSPGPIFYRQERLGQDGVRFGALKFRTMHGDGEERLKELLARDPKRRAEYEEFHKLNNDPRITRFGKILRRYSLDELPQLWSVLVGDMSLIGPRPYLEREVPDMNQQEAIVLRAKPGITGIWQVTDRNATGFEQRVSLDVEYVRNWSPWLDIYILARTVPAVLVGTGS